MRRGVPLGPTLSVAIAVPVMMALAWWQWFVRAPWKEALLSRIEANAAAPAIDLPARLTADLAFRKARVRCDQVGPTVIGGAAETVGGVTGFRRQALCERRGEPVMLSLGVSRDPRGVLPAGAPGALSGRLIPRGGDPAYLLVLDTPVPPLLAEAAPSSAAIPNNHRSYAGQWLGFATTLALIYALYVRRWRRGG